MIQCNNLNEVRGNIDRIDNEIVRLIAERSLYVRQAASFKKDTEAVRGAKRVEMVIDKVRKQAGECHVSPDLVEAVYRTMIDSFIRLELEEYEKRSETKV